ncbi:MAG: cyclic nucleotide-binding domain-containing protein [Oligoflexus sp.]
MSPTSALIIGGIALCLAYVLWQFINSQNAVKARRKRQRRSDRVKLTHQQKKVYIEAQRLYKEGKYKNCAKLLETLGMTREAISILEKAKHIHDAAAVLLRIHRPNRAGNMFARHGYWKEATECFKRANLPNEVGRCAREAGDLATAVAYFLEAKNLDDATECLTELGKHRDAAKLYAKVGKHELAIEQYQIMVDKNPNFYDLELSPDEIKIITTYLSKGIADIRLADIQIIKDHMVDVIISLIKRSKFDIAQKIYQRTNSDIGPQLIAQEDLTVAETEMIAKVFYNGGAFEYAGMVFERLGIFDQAAESFEKGEDFERAAYCYERSGLHEKATAMRIQLAGKGPKQSTQEKHKAPANQAALDESFFAIGDSTLYDNKNAISLDDNDANFTMVLQDIGKSRRPAPSQRGVDIPSPEMAHLNHQGINKNSPSANSGPPIPVQEEYGIQWKNFWENEFLRDLTTDQKELFKQVGKMQTFPKGSIILDYEEEPLGIYFVLAGNVQVFKQIDGEENRLEDLHPTEFFGEFWLLMDQLSKVRFQAASLCEVMTISRPDFEDIMDKNGTIARKLYKRFTQRLLTKLINSENAKENLEAS